MTRPRAKPLRDIRYRHTLYHNAGVGCYPGSSSLGCAAFKIRTILTALFWDLKTLPAFRDALSLPGPVSDAKFYSLPPPFRHIALSLEGVATQYVAGESRSGSTSEMRSTRFCLSRCVRFISFMVGVDA